MVIECMLVAPRYHVLVLRKLEVYHTMKVLFFCLAALVENELGHLLMVAKPALLQLLLATIVQSIHFKCKCKNYKYCFFWELFYPGPTINRGQLDIFVWRKKNAFVWKKIYKNFNYHYICTHYILLFTCPW